MRIIFHLKEMLDSVGIRLPKYKVREMGISLKKDGTIIDDVIDKLSFVQVCREERWRHQRCRLTLFFHMYKCIHLLRLAFMCHS